MEEHYIDTFSNGNIRFHQIYVRGLLQGISTEFDMYGEKIKEELYKSDEKMKEWVYTNGILVQENDFMENEIHRSVEYLWNGEKKSYHDYKNSKKSIGYFYRNGVCIKECIYYKNGHKCRELFNNDGNFLLDSAFIEKSFYKNGYIPLTYKNKKIFFY